MNMRKILGLLLCVAISGCISLPKTPIYGQYLQTYYEEMPVVEIAYSSESECERSVNLEMQQLDANARQNVMSGRLRMLCSNNSLKDKLPNKSVLVELLTGRKIEARFVSNSACTLVLSELKSKAHTIECGS